MNGIGFMQFAMGAALGQGETASVDSLTAGDIKQNPGEHAFSQLLNGELVAQAGTPPGFSLKLQKLAELLAEGQDLPASGNELPEDLVEFIGEGLPQATLQPQSQGTPFQQAGVLPPGLQRIQQAIQSSLTPVDQDALDDTLGGENGEAGPFIWNPVAMSVASSQQGGGALPQVAMDMMQRGHLLSPSSSNAMPHLGEQGPLTQAVSSLAGSEMPVTPMTKEVLPSLLPMQASAMPEVMAAQANDKVVEGLMANAAKQDVELAPTVPQGGVSVVGDKPVVSPQLRPAVEMQMQVPLDKPEWGKDLGNRILWMTKQEVQSARVQLNPPHLGPIEVRVSVHNDVANVSFLAHHAQVKEAIEMALPRLREMMDANGFSQTDVDVSDHSFAQTHEQMAERESGGAWNEDGADGSDLVGGELADDETAMTLQSQGLVDYFA